MWHTAVRLVLATAAVLVGCGLGAGQGNDAFKSGSKVKASATADKPGADGKQVITVRLAIEKGWHIYANPPGESGTATTVKVEGKKAEDVKVEYPEGKTVKDPQVGTYFVWEDDATIKVTVPRARDESSVKLKVKFQACNDKTCLMPATVELTVP
jgi:DsbC/DsbD-like thiol-disulfide interchange protein